MIDILWIVLSCFTRLEDTVLLLYLHYTTVIHVNKNMFPGLYFIYFYFLKLNQVLEKETKDQLRTHRDLSNKLSKKQQEINSTLIKLDREIKLRWAETSYQLDTTLLQQTALGSF